MFRSLFGSTDSTVDVNGTQGNATGAAKQGAATAASAAREADDVNKGGFFKLDPAEVSPGKLRVGVT